MIKKTGVTRIRQRLVISALLAFAIFPLGCTPGSEPLASDTSDPQLSEVPSATSSLAQNPTDPGTQQSAMRSASEKSAGAIAPGQNRYQSDRFDFSFTYPDGFELTVTHPEESSEEYVTLLRQEDVSDPEPPFIGIGVYENPQRLSLEAFQEQIGYFILNEFPDTTVAGQRALDFVSAGLYESRTHLFKTPEGTHVVSLTATYLDTISETDPLWQVAQTLRDSFEWRSPSASDNLPMVAQVEAFTLDELFEQGGGGCGMSLLQPNAQPGEGCLFTNGIDNPPALMKLNGQWVRLTRTEASGEEFYGQQTSQTFVSEDGAVTIEIDVSLGAVGEIESVEFADVQFKVIQDNQLIEVVATGGAGC